MEMVRCAKMIAEVDDAMANAEVTVAEFFDDLKRQRRAAPPQMPSAEAMIELAKEALGRERKDGPALLLAAVNYRIGEIAPDADPWTVINRVAKARQHAGIASSYSAVVDLKAEADQHGGYDRADAELCYELGEIVLSLLDEHYG